MSNAAPSVATDGAATTAPRHSDRLTQGVLLGIALGIAAALYLLIQDAVIAIAVGAGSFAIGRRIAQARSDHVDRDHSYR